jgi:Mycoplasma protein of unknown function, DUF285
MRSRIGKRRPQGLQRLSQMRPWWWPSILILSLTISACAEIVVSPAPGEGSRSSSSSSNGGSTGSGNSNTNSDAVTTYALRPQYGNMVTDEEANLNRTVLIDDTNFKTLIHHCLKSHEKTACDSMAHWDVSRVTDCSLLFWEPSNGSDEEWVLLRGADVFNVDISAWDTRSCTTMQSMFNGAVAFDQPIGNWNVQQITDMSHM